MSACAVAGCDGTMQGSMLACPPHWSLLTQPLRLALVLAWDNMARAVIAGADTGVERGQWLELARRAHEEWTAVREELRLADPDDPRGIEWVRARRRLGQEVTRG